MTRVYRSNNHFILPKKEEGSGGRAAVEEGRGEGKDGGRYTRDGTAVGKGGGKAAVEEEAGCEFGGSRFPRDVGRKVPAGPVLSPRQDDQPAVSNIKPTCTGSLSSTRYPNLPSDRQRSLRVSPSSSIHGSPPLSAIKTYRLVGLPPRSLHLTRFPLKKETFLLQRSLFKQLIERERERGRMVNTGILEILSV